VRLQHRLRPSLLRWPSVMLHDRRSSLQRLPLLVQLRLMLLHSHLHRATVMRCALHWTHQQQHVQARWLQLQRILQPSAASTHVRSQWQLRSLRRCVATARRCRLRWKHRRLRARVQLRLLRRRRQRLQQRQRRRLHRSAQRLGPLLMLSKNRLQFFAHPLQLQNPC